MSLKVRNFKDKLNEKLNRVPGSEGSSLPAVDSAHGSPITSPLLSPGHSLDSLESEPDLHFTRASLLVGHSLIVVDREDPVTESKQVLWQTMKM